MPQKQFHGPHILLATHDEALHEYDLFVGIFCYEGESISKTIEYLGGITSVNYQVSGSPSSQTEAIYFDRCLLNPDPASGVFEEFTVEVACTRDNVKKEAVMFYIHADQDIVPAGDKAQNSPYIYLKMPQALEGESLGSPNRIEFDPYCLVPLMADWKLDHQVGIIENESYIQTIDLIQDSQAPEAILFSELDSNSQIYIDAGVINGYFEVTVQSINPPKKQKARIRNRDSDTNPNKFIDTDLEVS
jgi:hypothetical protein